MVCRGFPQKWHGYEFFPKDTRQCSAYNIREFLRFEKEISLRTQTYFRLSFLISAERNDSRKYVCFRRLERNLRGIRFL